MNLYPREPEYILDSQSEKTIHSSHQSKDTKSISLVQVEVDLEVLSRELSILAESLSKIRVEQDLLLASVRGI